MGEVLNKEEYEMVCAGGLAELDQFLDESLDVGMALVDVSGFGSEIWERCERIRSMGIPFITISSKQNRKLQQASISTGARGYMTKPLVMKELLEVIRVIMASPEE